ncbi:MAG: hypothetical protein U0U66_08030 [Cytophagaceae bacterium]
MRHLVLLTLVLGWAQMTYAQNITATVDFQLASPFHEPDGRNDVVDLPGGDYVMLAKSKGSTTGKAEFILERIKSSDLSVVWQSTLSIESSEDFKDLYFDGNDLRLLSVMHEESQKKTSLLAYSFDVQNGTQKEKKSLESYPVSDWVEGEHRGKVKESFLDVVCEHTEPGFVTPFEYKHNISFSHNDEHFVSYVFSYGQKTLTANVAVYTKQCVQVASGKVMIDNDYTNYGILVNNKKEIFIVNANGGGRLNVIRYNLESKNFDVLELPPSSYKKDEIQTQWMNDDVFYVGAVALYSEKLMGFSYGKFDFAAMAVSHVVYDGLDDKIKKQVEDGRTSDKQIKGAENWLDYDLVEINVSATGDVTMIIEKRTFYVDGYPHIGMGTFDKKHQVQLNGHVHAEGILVLHYKNDQRAWTNYIAKNQVYPGSDGVNTISFVSHFMGTNDLQLLFVTSTSLDASYFNLNYKQINLESGKIVQELSLPNPEKLMLVRDYTIWPDQNQLIIVGRKGLLGKASRVVKYTW